MNDSAVWPSADSKRVALVSGAAHTLLASRAPLIHALVAAKCPVLCLAPEFSSEQEAKLAFMGAEAATFELVPKGPALLADWRISRALAEKLASWKADVVVGMTERVMALTLIAARRARVGRRIALFNGFAPRELDAVVGYDPLRASPWLLSKALKAAHIAVFHNRDDRRSLQREALLPAGLETRIVPGAGVDLTAFPSLPLPPIGDGLIFLMIASLNEARGVLDYCKAAERVKERAPHTQFLLAGPSGSGATGMKLEALRPYAASVKFLGPLADVAPALGSCHVFVYPSRREGMPLAVLEALSCGRPVITTSAPGCRDTVDDCVNGCLVAPGDVPALEDAMASLLKRPDLLASMARASRIKAERHFDRRAVLAAWRDILELEQTQAVSNYWLVAFSAANRRLLRRRMFLRCDH